MVTRSNSAVTSFFCNLVLLSWSSPYSYDDSTYILKSAIGLSTPKGRIFSRRQPAKLAIYHKDTVKEVCRTHSREGKAPITAALSTFCARHTFLEFHDWSLIVRRGTVLDSSLIRALAIRRLMIRRRLICVSSELSEVIYCDASRHFRHSPTDDQIILVHR